MASWMPDKPTRMVIGDWVILGLFVIAVVLVVLFFASAADAKRKWLVGGCLGSLIQRESRWDVHATNPRTGAYGLPQALPGSKMRSAGRNWRHNPWVQIRWMRRYVNGRYGGACAALTFQVRNGWY